MALEEAEAALGLGLFFWLQWQAFRLFLLTSLGGLVDMPLMDLIAMRQRLGFSTVVVVRVGGLLLSMTRPTWLG
jgi:hypothetical protein